MEGYEGPDGDASVADAGVATADAGGFLDAAGVEFGAQQLFFLGGEGVDDLDQEIDQHPDEMSGGDAQHLRCLAPYQTEKEISMMLTSR